jgi:hypothetical protein
MASIQEEILKEFCSKLGQAEGFSGERVSQIRDLFSASKKPKPVEIMKILSEKPESTL